MILLTQIIPRKQTQKIEKAFSILQHRTLKSREAQDDSRLTGPGVTEGRRERRRAAAAPRASAAVGERGQCLMLLECMFASLKGHKLNVCTWRTYSIGLLGLPKQSPTNWVA